MDSTYTVPFIFDPLICPFIVVQTRINGAGPFPFILDTGTTGSLIVDTQVAQRIGLKPDARATTTFNRTLQLAATTVNTVEILSARPPKNLVLHPPRAFLADLSPMQQAVAGNTIAGILGIGILASLVVRLDFAAKEITLSKTRPTLAAGGNVSVVPLLQHRDSEAYYVRLIPVPGVPVDLLLDTGAAGTSLPLSVAIQMQPVATTGTFYLRAGARYFSQNMLIHRLRIADFVEPDVVLSSIPPPAVPVFGQNILSRFIVTLDFPRKEMVLQRDPRAASRLRPMGWTGIRLRQDGERYLVADVHARSPAQRAGVQTGDRLIAIDGLQVTGQSIVLVSRVRDGFAGMAAHLTLQRGDARPFSVTFVREDTFTAPQYAIDGLTFSQPAGEAISIDRVERGCAADRAGLQAGDAIVQINGIPVTTMQTQEFADQVTKPELRLVVRRRGKTDEQTTVLKSPDSDH